MAKIAVVICFFMVLSFVGFCGNNCNEKKIKDLLAKMETLKKVQKKLKGVNIELEKIIKELNKYDKK